MKKFGEDDNFSAWRGDTPLKGREPDGKVHSFWVKVLEKRTGRVFFVDGYTRRRGGVFERTTSGMQAMKEDGLLESVGNFLEVCKVARAS